ncbi:MAG TPA: hypothetical protein VEK35_09060 [Roseiarcus sp.]|nr:hypothetical protein [Roseiarcus sp.]
MKRQSSRACPAAWVGAKLPPSFPMGKENQMSALSSEILARARRQRAALARRLQ